MRNYRGLTLEEAAKKLGISKQALNAKEHSEMGITLRSFNKIAESYNFRLLAVPEEELTRLDKTNQDE